MIALPVHKSPDDSSGGAERSKSGGCGSCGSGGGSCGEGLEKVYPTTAVRYGAMNWIGEFRYQPKAVFRCGAKVVIETERGMELGQQVSLFCNGCSKQVTREQIQTYVKNSGPEFYQLSSGRVVREATSADQDEQAHLDAHRPEYIAHCALLAAQLNLEMKIVTAESLLGGDRIVFYFRSDQRVDFRQLVRELARHHRTRIEMRQVGARDEARLVADYEICGRECCCKNFLKKLRPVNMKMAKVQKSTLDPSKVSGRCGRLRCCLRYEHEGYEALMAKLPPMNARVQTEYGEAVVIDRQILTQLLLVRTLDNRDMALPVEEVRVLTAPPPGQDDHEHDEHDGDLPPPSPRDAGPSRPPLPRPPAPPQSESDSSPEPGGPPPADSGPPRRSRRRRRRGPRPGGPPGPRGSGPDAGPGPAEPDPSS
ncbi:hypothetical protein RAS1_18910 [Phycisphaerae bacterium RAS1]|nr:hypothetical protein RAS1_18910 [Phycisphaerae bacterium RAS1]